MREVRYDPWLDCSLSLAKADCCLSVVADVEGEDKPVFGNTFWSHLMLSVFSTSENIPLPVSCARDHSNGQYSAFETFESEDGWWRPLDSQS